MVCYRERDGRIQAIVRVQRKGKPPSRVARTFRTRHDAEQWGEPLEQSLRATLKSGIHMTCFADIIDQFRELRAEGRPLQRSVQYDLDLLRERLGGVLLGKLSANTFVAFARQRRTEGAGPATVLHNLSVARSAMNTVYAMTGAGLDGSAVKQAIRGLSMSGAVAKSRSIARRLLTSEQEALQAEFERVASHPTNKVPMHKIFPLALALPRRREELVSMRWADYDGKVLVLRDTKHPLRARTERIPVPPEAQEILATLPRVDERILPYQASSVSKAFERACARLGIDDLRFHDLRHEGISRLFERGLGVQEVTLISGHLSWATLARYTHIQPERVLEKLNARVD